MAKKVKLEELTVKSFITTHELKGGLREGGMQGVEVREVDSIEEDTQWGQTMCTETACLCA